MVTWFSSSSNPDQYKGSLTIPMAAPAVTRVWGLSFAGIVGSNPARGMDICFLLVLCIVGQRSLRRADPSSRAVLPAVECLN